MRHVLCYDDGEMTCRSTPRLLLVSVLLCACGSGSLSDALGGSKSSGPTSSDSTANGSSDNGSTTPEEPLDSEKVDNDAPVPTGKKRVFLSSTGYDGVTVATRGNALCQTLADAESLGGNWVAWYSTKWTNAIDRIRGGGPFVLLDGRVAFNNKSGFATSPRVGITITERGEEAYFATVWTFTDVGGTLGKAPANSVAQGNTGEASSDTLDERWTSSSIGYASQKLNIYCVEQ